MAGSHFRQDAPTGAGRPSGMPQNRTRPSVDATPQPSPRSDSPFGNPFDQTGQFPKVDQKVEYYDFNTFSGSGDDGELIRKKHRRKKRVWPIVVGVIVVLLVAVGASGFVLARSAKTVMADAKSAVSLAGGLTSQIVEGGQGGQLEQNATQIAELASKMDSELSNPLWAVASVFPVVGGDVSAARTMVSVLDDVAQNALVPIAKNLTANPVNKLIQDGGSIDVASLQTLVGTVPDVTPVLTQANEKVQAISSTSIPKVTELVDKAKDGFAQMSSAATTASKISGYLPQMLGADGNARNYLIVAENNAEIRALGGFSGSAGVLTMENGQIHLGDFDGTKTLADAGGATDQITISDEERALFQPDGDTLDYTAGDSFFIPDFPRGAEFSRIIWALNHNGQHVDGVIAVDPIFLQYLLQLTGSVTAIDGTVVDGTNAAKVLLSDVYWKYPTDGKIQDAVFASVAEAAFDKLIGSMGSLDIVKLAKAVERAASEGRLLVWMENEDEQAVIKEIGVDGALPTDASKPVTGVYVNNYSYSKLDWHLDMDVTKGAATYGADGSATYAMTVKLTNTMTAEEEANIPSYVEAHNGSAETPGQEILGFYLYAPKGGTITNVNSTYGDMTQATHNGLEVYYSFVRMKPGESIEVTYTVTVPKEGAQNDLVVHETPTAEGARKGEAAL